MNFLTRTSLKEKKYIFRIKNILETKKTQKKQKQKSTMEKHFGK